jgi:ABC-type transport system involved in cytochrome c biogenesis permease subunit
MISVHRGRRSRWTMFWMLAVFLCQLAFLGMRGEQRAACPLADRGEILVFLSWSLTLFYLLVGPAYRISLLGVFTAPVIVVFQTLALLPGVLQSEPQRLVGGNPWHETHSATSVLAYGALALAAVAGVMFLVLDRQLLVSLTRLLWLGGGLLTIGIIAGFLMPHDKTALGHLLAALAVWTGYAILLGTKSLRGLTGRRLSLAAVLLFILSLGVFAFV